MPYFIIGHTINLSVHSNIAKTNENTGEKTYYDVTENRQSVQTQQIKRAYPSKSTVKLFQSEEDALHYANYLAEKTHEFKGTDKRLKPIFEVEYKNDKDELAWTATSFTYKYIKYFPERGNFNNGQTHEIQKTTTIYTVDVLLEKLKRLSGRVKEYGFFDEPHSKIERGEVSYQKSCCPLL